MVQHQSECREASLVTTYASHKGGTYCLAFRPFMKHLVSGGADGAVLLWSLFCRPNAHTRHTQIRPYRYVGHQGAVHAVAVSPQDSVVASASKDRTVRLWLPTAEGKCSVIRGHGGAIRTVAFSSDGRCLLTGSDDKTIKLWNVETEKFLLTLNGHINWVRSAEFNGDGRYVVSGSDDKTVRLWDVEKHECIHTFTDIVGMVYCARFSPDGACIGSSGSDHSIQELCNQFAFTHLEIIFSLLVMIQRLRFGTCGKAGCYICCRAMNVLRLVHSILQLESILPQEAWMSMS